MDLLTTTDEVIEKLGGTAAVARLVGRPAQHVSSWRGSAFPSKTYLALTAALTLKGYTAPPSLWRMIEASDEAPDQRASA